MRRSPRGQALTIGVVGGVRAAGDVNTFVTMPESRRYVVGPSVELRLPRNLSTEVDALYHRQGYRYVAPPIIGLSGIYDESERANSWEFPIMLTYKLTVPIVKVFVEAGLSARTISGTAADVNVVFNCCAYSPPTYTTTKVESSGLGIVAGGAVQFSIGRLRVSPEAWYTYWTSAPSFGSGSIGFSVAGRYSRWHWLEVSLGFWLRPVFKPLTSSSFLVGFED